MAESHNKSIRFGNRCGIGGYGLQSPTAMAFTASDRVRARLREEMARKNLNQTDMAGQLSWTQSRMSKVLNGRTQLGVDELSQLCWAVGISMTEAVRDHGYEFAAEMTPTELRALQQIRSLPKHLHESVLMLIAHSAEKVELEQRTARPLKKKVRR